MGEYKINQSNPKLDGWDRGSHRMSRSEFGVWEIVVPAQDGQPAISHNSKIKVCGYLLNIIFRLGILSNYQAIDLNDHP